jgi:hypothetical protein
MYRSPEGRDADIEELAGAPATEIRDRLMASVTRLEAAIEAIAGGGDLAGTMIERTPGSSMRFAAGAVAWMRLREVEIHHADLGPQASYSPADWPEEFTVRLLQHNADRWDGPGFTAGIVTGARIVAVNGTAYDQDGIKAAITAAKTGKTLDLLIQRGDRYLTVPLNYRGGLRYPWLERVPGKAPAGLDALLTPRRALAK